jgi:aspartate/methionine/tyrosine aminotransferase
MKPFARRLSRIEPFHVMDILARARAMEAQGRSIIHMEIGEPDFPTAEGIVQAGVAALQAGHTHYTPALGLSELRVAIAASYPAHARPDPARVVVTPGASGALQLIFTSLINPAIKALADPGYPCNRHFVRLFEEAVAFRGCCDGVSTQRRSDPSSLDKRTVAVLSLRPQSHRHADIRQRDGGDRASRGERRRADRG